MEFYYRRHILTIACLKRRFILFILKKMSTYFWITVVCQLLFQVKTIYHEKKVASSDCNSITQVLYLENARIEIIRSVPKNIQPSKYLSYQFPWSRVPSSTLNSLRGCWRSPAIAAWGSISIEVDGKRLCCSVGNVLGKCQFVVAKGKYYI